MNKPTSKTARATDPFMAFNFRVEIGQVLVMGVTEVSGLQAEIEVKEVQEGGLNTYVHQLPGPMKIGNRITLKRGLTTDQSIWTWLTATGTTRFEKKSLLILLNNFQGAWIRSWLIRDAFPVKWVGPSMRSNPSGDGAIAFETVELAHHGITYSGKMDRD